MLINMNIKSQYRYFCIERQILSLENNEYKIYENNGVQFKLLGQLHTTISRFLKKVIPFL